MKVLILYPEFYVYGGGEVLVVRLVEGLARLGIETGIMTCGMIPEVEADLGGAEVIRIEHIDRNRSARRSTAGMIRSFRKGLKRRGSDFDVVNPHNFPTEIAAFRCPRPAVWLCNEPELHLLLASPEFATLRKRDRRYFHRMAFWSRRLMRFKFHACVVADEGNATRFRKLFGKRPEIVPYGIDYDVFAEPAEPVNRPDLAGRFVVLHVGMLTAFKNQVASLEAVAAVRDRVPHIVLVFAGGGGLQSYRTALEARIRELGIEDRVIFTGHIDRNELRRYMAASDVMLHPIKPQGGWLSPFEMLSAGKPIIVSREMTAASLIEREGIGWVTDDYGAALTDVHDHPDRHRAMAVRGREYVKTNLSWDRFCERMAALYRAAAENRWFPRIRKGPERM